MSATVSKADIFRAEAAQRILLTDGAFGTMIQNYGLDEAAYREELQSLGTRILLVSPTKPADLPTSWTYVGAGPLTPEMLRDGLQDATERHAYISGAPRLVREVRQVLKRSGVRRVTTDAFSGY